MFNSIFLKTLYERRLSTAIWTLAMIITTFLIMLLFPSLQESFGTALKDVPESMQKLLGNAEDYQTITGFVDIQVVGQMVFLTIIMGVISGTSLLAGEENSGTLQTLLAQPVRRVSVYLQKFWALCVMTWFVAFVGLFIGVLTGVIAVGESIDIGHLALASGMTWLLTLFFAVMAYGIGAATGSRALSGILTGFYAFVGYMLTALAGAAAALEKLDYASPFHYFNQPSVLRNGLDAENILVLSAATLFFFLLGLIVFRKRDIFQR